MLTTFWASISSLPRSQDRGLIEAACSRHSGLPSPPFRGRKTAASLKRLGSARLISWRKRTFRGRKTAASLKRRFGSPVAASNSRSFRGRKTAASLKPSVAANCAICCCCLPRSQDRGLIEARGWWVAALTAMPLPRSQDRGLIEASGPLAPPFACARPSAVARPRPH